MTKKITTSVKVDPLKRDAAYRMGYDLSYILDRGLDQYINGIVIEDNFILDKLKEDRRRLMERAADLTVKELALRAKRENIETEIKSLSEEIGAIEGKKESDTNSDRITELLRELNSVIVDNNYVYDDIYGATGDIVEELGELMPSFNLEKQIEIIKNFST